MLKSVMIGGVCIDFPIGLAPLAGSSDKTYRNICLDLGAGFVCTEMVSAKAVVYKNKNTHILLQTGDNEHPVFVQLFGSEPDALSAACEIIYPLPFDIVDFNMGCPVPKVVKNGEGSALMTDTKKAEAAMRALVKAAGKPVSVKIRSGFDKEHINAAEIARIAEDCGVSAVTVHARTREQYYSGSANRSVIKAVKEAVKIPVFGNGDVADGPSAKRMIEETGCDGIMIGRAAMGDPWIFGRIRRYFAAGEELLRPDEGEIFGMIIRHAELLCEECGEYMAIRQMRSHAANYLKGMHGAARLRGRINDIKTLEELKNLFS